MNKLKLFVGSLLLAISGLAGSTTILDVNSTLGVGIIGPQSPIGYLFNVPSGGTYTASFTVGSSPLALELFGVFDAPGYQGPWTKLGDTVGSGSFSFIGGSALQYIAIVEGANLSGSALPYNITVFHTPAVPEPESWAMMLLGIGFVLYQVRPRNSAGGVNITG